jgi:hypothetical protein
MKRLFTIISALLITAGLKAQSSNVQKETTPPVARMNTPTKEVNNAAIKNTTVIKKVEAKDAGFKNAAIKNVASKNTKIKKAAVVADKADPAKQ